MKIVILHDFLCSESIDYVYDRCDDTFGDSHDVVCMQTPSTFWCYTSPGGKVYFGRCKKHSATVMNTYKIPRDGHIQRLTQEEAIVVEVMTP